MLQLLVLLYGSTFSSNCLSLLMFVVMTDLTHNIYSYIGSTYKAHAICCQQSAELLRIILIKYLVLTFLFNYLLIIKYAEFILYHMITHKKTLYRLPKNVITQQPNIFTKNWIITATHLLKLQQHLLSHGDITLPYLRRMLLPLIFVLLLECCL